MSEKGKEDLTKIMGAIPKMSEFQRGRLFGFAEALEEQNRKESLEDDKETEGR